MTPIFESDVEEFVIELLQSQGFDYLSPEQQEAERLPAFGADKPDLTQVVLLKRLRNAIDTLNPAIPAPMTKAALVVGIFLVSTSSIFLDLAIPADINFMALAVASFFCFL